MKKKTLLIIAFFAVLLGTSACKKDEGDPGANEVWIKDMGFSPSSKTVALNTTITWTNKDGTTHTVTSNNGQFDSGHIGDGGTFSFKFDSVGTYAYHCTLHSSMNGTIIVQ